MARRSLMVGRRRTPAGVDRVHAPVNPWLARRSCPTPTRAAPGSGPRRPSSPSGRRWRPARRRIELDVHATADGELVVCHDATVDRTTDGRGRIADLTLAELQATRQRLLVHPRGRRHPGPAGRGVPLPRPGRPTTPTSGSPPCARCSRRSPAWCSTSTSSRPPRWSPPTRRRWPPAGRVRADRRRDRGLVPRPGHRRLLGGRAGRAHVGRDAGHRRLLAGRARRHRTGRDCGPSPSRYPSVRGIWWWSTRPSSRRPTSTGIAVHVWTVNDAEAMERLVDLGVDGIISDLPTVLSDVLRRSGVAWDGDARARR